MKLDPESCEQYCDTKDTEAWSLASDQNLAVYLQHESELGFAFKDPFFFNSLPRVGSQPGFDFSSTNYAATFPSFGHKSAEGKIILYTLFNQEKKGTLNVFLKFICAEEF